MSIRHATPHTTTFRPIADVKQTFERRQPIELQQLIPLGIKRDDAEALLCLRGKVTEVLHPDAIFEPQEDPGVYFIRGSKSEKTATAVFKIGIRRARMEQAARVIAHRLGLSRYSMPCLFFSFENLPFPASWREDYVEELWSDKIKTYLKSQSPHSYFGILEPFIENIMEKQETDLPGLFLLALALGLRDGKEDNFGKVLLDTEECMPNRLDAPFGNMRAPTALHLPILGELWEIANRDLPPSSVADLKSIVAKWQVDAVTLCMSQEKILFMDRKSESVSVEDEEESDEEPNVAHCNPLLPEDIDDIVFERDPETDGEVEKVLSSGALSEAEESETDTTNSEEKVVRDTARYSQSERDLPRRSACIADSGFCSVGVTSSEDCDPLYTPKVHVDEQSRLFDQGQIQAFKERLMRVRTYIEENETFSIMDMVHAVDPNYANNLQLNREMCKILDIQITRLSKKGGAMPLLGKLQRAEQMARQGFYSIGRENSPFVPDAALQHPKERAELIQREIQILRDKVSPRRDSARFSQTRLAIPVNLEETFFTTI